jgi:hypothetical protein
MTRNSMIRPPLSANDVNAVDVLALHGGLELEYGDVTGQDLLRVMEAFTAHAGLRASRRAQQRGGGGLEVLLGDRLAALRRKDDR